MGCFSRTLFSKSMISRRNFVGSQKTHACGRFLLGHTRSALPTAGFQRLCCLPKVWRCISHHAFWIARGFVFSGFLLPSDSPLYDKADSIPFVQVGCCCWKHIQRLDCLVNPRWHTSLYTAQHFRSSVQRCAYQGPEAHVDSIFTYEESCQVRKNKNTYLPLCPTRKCSFVWKLYHFVFTTTSQLLHN